MELVEVRVSWPGHPRYQKKKKKHCVAKIPEDRMSVKHIKF